MSLRIVENTPSKFVLNQKIEAVFYRLNQLTGIADTLLHAVSNTQNTVVKEYALRFEIFTKQIRDVLTIIEPLKKQFEKDNNLVESYLLFVPFEALKVINEGMWQLENDGPNSSKVDLPHEEAFIASISGVTSMINEAVLTFESLINDQQKLAA